MKDDFTIATKDAATELGVTASRVRQLFYAGILSAKLIGRDLFISERSIDKAKQRKTLPGPAKKDQQD